MKWDGKGSGDWCPRPLEEHRQKTFHSLCRLNHWLLSCGMLNRDSWEPSPHHHRVGFLQTHSLSSRPNHINKPNTHAEKKWQKRLRSIRTLPAERTAWEAGCELQEWDWLIELPSASGAARQPERLDRTSASGSSQNSSELSRGPGGVTDTVSSAGYPIMTYMAKIS